MRVVNELVFGQKCKKLKNIFGRGPNFRVKIFCRFKLVSVSEKFRIDVFEAGQFFGPKFCRFFIAKVSSTQVLFCAFKNLLRRVLVDLGFFRNFRFSKV